MEQIPGWEIGIVVSQEGEGREQRLALAFNFVMGRLGLTPEQLASRLEELEDHEGNLIVTWSIQPSDAEREAWFLAWEAQNEVRENVIQGAPNKRPYEV
jgi:hypothetical protein